MTGRYCPTSKTGPEEKEMYVAIECLDLGLARAEGLPHSGREKASDHPRDPCTNPARLSRAGATTLFSFCMEVGNVFYSCPKTVKMGVIRCIH